MTYEKDEEKEEQEKIEKQRLREKERVEMFLKKAYDFAHLGNSQQCHQELDNAEILASSHNWANNEFFNRHSKILKMAYFNGTESALHEAEISRKSGSSLYEAKLNDSVQNEVLYVAASESLIDYELQIKDDYSEDEKTEINTERELARKVITKNREYFSKWRKKIKGNNG